MATAASALVHVILHHSLRHLCRNFMSLLFNYQRLNCAIIPSYLLLFFAIIHDLDLHNPSTSHKIISHGLVVNDHFQNHHRYRRLRNLLQETNQLTHRLELRRNFTWERTGKRRVTEIGHERKVTSALWRNLEVKTDEIPGTYKWYRYLWRLQGCIWPQIENWT